MGSFVSRCWPVALIYKNGNSLRPVFISSVPKKKKIRKSQGDICRRQLMASSSSAEPNTHWTIWWKIEKSAHTHTHHHPFIYKYTHSLLRARTHTRNKKREREREREKLYIGFLLDFHSVWWQPINEWLHTQKRNNIYLLLEAVCKTTSTASDWGMCNSLSWILYKQQDCEGSSLFLFFLQSRVWIVRAARGVSERELVL